MGENKTHVCEFTGESCYIRAAIDVAVTANVGRQTEKRVEELGEKNCTVVECEPLREKARELLAKQPPSLAALPKDWSRYHAE